MGSEGGRALRIIAALAFLVTACGELEDGGLEHALAGAERAATASPDTSTSRSDTVVSGLDTLVSGLDTLVSGLDTLVSGSDTPHFPCEVGAPAAVYVEIPAGQFTMGSPVTEDGRGSDEQQHEVTLTRSFALKATEVTQAEWRALIGNAPAGYSGCDECPVESVTWWDALAYCNALSRAEGREECYALDGCTGGAGDDLECESVTFVGLDCAGYRLPTEAEWEYAYRAGTTTAWYGGDRAGDVDAIAWYAGNADGLTQPVAQKCPNAWALYDMAGNVWEWCWDRYGDYPAGAVDDPMGDEGGSRRVFRGGSWSSSAPFVRAARRDRYYPGSRYDGLGFRPARSIP